MESDRNIDSLHGYFFPETGHFNIVSDPSLPVLGTVGSEGKTKNELRAYYNDEGIQFIFEDTECRKKPYELTLNIFSRNTGILETGVMLNKSAIIAGCGSVGSLVAMELARSGVGSFMLVDNDILEYHNICRHQCGVKDVGRYKADALEEKILNINPNARIVKQNTILERVKKEDFDSFCTKDTVIIGCGDNRESDLYANNNVSFVYDIPFVSIGFWERAFAGEIFYSIPGSTACYNCQFENFKEDGDARVNSNHRFYLDETNLQDAKFEPGISVDINFVTNIGIKIVLDILNMNDSSYIPRVMNHLSQYTLICNTNDVRIGGERAEIFSYPLQVTTSIRINKRSDCKICSDFLR